MLGVRHARRVVPFVFACVLALLLLPALLIAAQEPTPTSAAPQPPGAPLPLATEPAVTGGPVPSTPTPTSLFQLLFADSFDDENYTANFWTFGAGWEQRSIGGRGQVLEVSGSEAPMTYLHSPLADVVAEVRFLVHTGAAQLTIRESSLGSYALQMDSHGQASLYRGETILMSDSVSRFGSRQWHTLRLAAIGNGLHVWVDGNPLFETQDNNPLPAGAISFAGRELGNGTLRVDDFSLWIPAQTPPTAIPTISAVDLPAEPQLQMIFQDTFDDAALTSGMWAPDGWERGLYGEKWVLGSTSGGSARFTNTQLSDFAVDLRFRAASGTFQVHARQGEGGAYTVAIGSEGQIGLWRGELRLGAAQLTDYVPEEWHRLWFSVIGGVIRLGIDDEQVIATQDSLPLPPGAVAIEGNTSSSGTLLVDDFALWVPVKENDSAAASGLTAVTTTESLYWDFNDRNYAGWYSGSPGDPLGYWAPGWPFNWGSGRCEHQAIRATAGYEGLTDWGWGTKTTACPNGHALNAVYDLGQPVLVSSVSYGVRAVFEGLGRWQEIRLIDENFQLVLAKRYTIPSTGYGEKTHTLTTPTYVRYIQVMAHHGGGLNIIWDWVRLSNIAPTPTSTPTPSPTPTATPTETPTATPTEEACTSDPPPNWGSSVVQFYIAVPETDPQAYDFGMGTFIDMGRNCFLTHSHWPDDLVDGRPGAQFLFASQDDQTGHFVWDQVTYEFVADENGRVEVGYGQTLFCLDKNVPSGEMPPLQPLGTSPDPKDLVH